MGRAKLDRYGEASSASATQVRRDEAREAAKVLGVRTVDFCNFPEVHLEFSPLPRLIAPLTHMVSHARPQVVYTHHWSDLNQDHRKIAEASLVALRPFSPRGVQTVYAYLVDPTGYPGIPTRCTVHVGLTDQQVTRKVKALHAYASEIREAPHPRSEAMLVDLAAVRGAAAGYPYAEAFELVWSRA